MKFTWELKQWKRGKGWKLIKNWLFVRRVHIYIVLIRKSIHSWMLRPKSKWENARKKFQRLFDDIKGITEEFLQLKLSNYHLSRESWEFKPFRQSLALRDRKNIADHVSSKFRDFRRFQRPRTPPRVHPHSRWCVSSVVLLKLWKYQQYNKENLFVIIFMPSISSPSRLHRVSRLKKSFKIFPPHLFRLLADSSPRAFPLLCSFNTYFFYEWRPFIPL